MRLVISLVVLAITVRVAAPYALEAVAQSPYQAAGNQMVVEAKFLALSSVNTATQEVLKKLQIEVDGSIACGKFGKFYSPTAAGADANGCVAPACE